MFENLVSILKEQREARQEEKRAEKPTETCPVIDTYGLGPVRDPDAYEIGGRPKLNKVA